ncbi:unnamed protein product [Effrenium voratum]|nr:unnamed protein product [Effrenium voratum]
MRSHLRARPEAHGRGLERSGLERCTGVALGGALLALRRKRGRRTSAKAFGKFIGNVLPWLDEKQGSGSEASGKTWKELIQLKDLGSSSFDKALQVNLDSSIYGSFAEIGAGQEVSRTFLTAGAAAGTVARSLSAYDMQISDVTYGKAKRYVTKERLGQMLKTEYDTLEASIREEKGPQTRFFAVATTLAAKAYMSNRECEGWVGMTFQHQAGAQPSTVQLHVRMADETAQLQGEAIGRLGTNLVYLCNFAKDPVVITSFLLDGIEEGRLEVDFVEFTGPAFPKEKMDYRLLAMKMVEFKVAPSVLLVYDEQKGSYVHAVPNNSFYKTPVVVQRSRFRPVTFAHREVIEAASKKLSRELGSDSRPVMQASGGKGCSERWVMQQISTARVAKPSFATRLLMTMGPGLMVCFADTDGSCLITAADSGSEWRYKLLLLQAILVPILYFAQELTVRLALVKGKGLCALLRAEVGPRVAWIVAVPLLIDCVLALISELNVFGQTLLACWDVPLWVSSSLFALGLIFLALTGSYAIAEKVGLAMGILQVFFFATIFMNHPSGSEVWNDLWSFPITNGSYVKLVTANIGAVIMPWMLAYQQSALCEKGLAGESDSENLLIERIDTAVGSLLTQGVMAAMLMTVAASKMYVGQDIETVDQLLAIFSMTLHGEVRAKVALSLSVCGACIVAAIVVSLCGSWALEEVLGRSSLPAGEGPRDCRGMLQRVSRNVQERPIFYASFFLTCLVAWALTIFTPTFAVALTGVWTQFINGLLMPPTIFSLWYLAAYTLPEGHKLGSFTKWSLFVIFGICSMFCFISIPFAIEDGFNQRRL